MHACERCNLSTVFSGLASASGFAFAELRDKIWILLSRPSGFELVATPRATPILLVFFLADRAAHGAARPVRCGDAYSRHHASPTSPLSSQSYHT